MIVHGCLKDTVIELLLLFVFFIVFTSLTLIVLFVFMYCIFIAIRLPCFNKLEFTKGRVRVELRTCMPDELGISSMHVQR